MKIQPWKPVRHHGACYLQDAEAKMLVGCSPHVVSA